MISKFTLRTVFLLLFISLSGLGYGQATLSKKDTSDVRFVNARKFYIYKVDKGETLFSISQKFNIPQEEILEFNKEIDGQGLKYKSKIWIPAYSWLKKDDDKSVKAAEEKDKHYDKITYKITLISALNYPKMYVSDSLNSDSTFIEEAISKDVKANLEFVEGALHAADVMTKSGFKSVIRIVDSEDDTLHVLKLMNADAIPDLIVTNASGNVLKWCAKYADDKGIKLISSGVNTSDQLKAFSNSISLLPSSLTQCKEMGAFMASEYPGSVAITVRTSQAKENERSAFFKLGWRRVKSEKEVTIDYAKGGVSSLIDSLSKSKTNIVFLSSSNEDMATTILSELKLHLSDRKIIVAGLPTWQYFETLDQNLLTQCNTIFSVRALFRMHQTC
ncbi:MAG: LysM peptidoglycan-binding domain-containing protein [Bacteroidetes bacterium]|nr:LysM peptidoglycan-binding domain-containing protein [Bacteroidota bacterium]